MKTLIIIPVFNEEKNIEKCLKSLLNQTHRIFLCGKEGWKNHVVATVPYGSILIQVIMQPVQDAAAAYTDISEGNQGAVPLTTTNISIGIDRNP